MKKVYLLEGLDCANCAAKIERKVSAVKGVESATVSFITTKMIIDLGTDDSNEIESILKEVVKIAKKTDPDINVKEVR